MRIEKCVCVLHIEHACVRSKHAEARTNGEKPLSQMTSSAFSTKYLLNDIVDFMMIFNMGTHTHIHTS